MPCTLLTPREGVADPLQILSLGRRLPIASELVISLRGVSLVLALPSPHHLSEREMRYWRDEMQDSLADRLLRSNKGHPGQGPLVAASRRSPFVLANLLRGVWLQLIRAWGRRDSAHVVNAFTDAPKVWLSYRNP